MTLLIPATLAILAYLISAWMIFRPVAWDHKKRLPQSFAWIAVLLHLAYTIMTTYHAAGFNFSFFSTASLVALIVSLLLLIAMLGMPVENLGILLFPLTGLMLLIDLCFSEKQRILSFQDWQMNTHIMTSIISFALLNIAAVQAILLTVQNQQLKSHPPKRYIQSMPPLQSMEVLLFQMIAVGWLFLTISLGTGFFFMEDIFAQHLAHKTFFSLLAWLVFAVLLAGRKLYGWRGQTAVKWTLIAFLFLLLAYFGSRLVREVILHR
jgi:ABC-type uncharacterized transport system permease subunit